MKRIIGNYEVEDTQRGVEVKHNGHCIGIVTGVLAMDLDEEMLDDFFFNDEDVDWLDDCGLIGMGNNARAEFMISQF